MSALGWVMKRSFELYFKARERAIEQRHKEYLHQVTANQQDQLARMAHEFQLAQQREAVRFSRLHERRAIVIVRLHRRINKLVRYHIHTTRHWNELSKNEYMNRPNEADKIREEAMFYLADHEIYFRSDQVKLIMNAFNALSRVPPIERELFCYTEQQDRSSAEAAQRLIELLDTVRARVFPALRALEDEFRTLLGVDLGPTRDKEMPAPISS